MTVAFLVVDPSFEAFSDDRSLTSDDFMEDFGA
jgi:hypothetical protein